MFSFIFLRGSRCGFRRVNLDRTSFVQFYAGGWLDRLCSLAFGALESRHVEESQKARRGIVVFFQIEGGHFCTILGLRLFPSFEEAGRKDQIGNQSKFPQSLTSRGGVLRFTEDVRVKWGILIWDVNKVDQSPFCVGQSTVNIGGHFSGFS